MIYYSLLFICEGINKAFAICCVDVICVYTREIDNNQRKLEYFRNGTLAALSRRGLDRLGNCVRQRKSYELVWTG